MKIQRISGIQKKYLINIVLLLALALLLSSVGVGVYVRKNISNVVLDKYEFMTEKMGITLDGLYKKSEEVTAECITDKNVQRSLQAAELELGEKNALSKYFAYTDLDYVSEYCYIDNKENVYTKSYSNLSYKDFKKSGIEKKLSSNYAKTQWFFQEDTLFQTGRSELFIGRNVRNMEDAHAPGMLFFKMDEKYLESIVEEQNGIEDIVVGVVDDKGNLCMQYTPESFALNEQDEEKITGLFKYKGAGMILERERLRSGMLQAYRQQESGFTIFTLVPNTVLNRGMTEIALVLLVIYLVVIIIAMEVSFYISKIFTKPILMLSKEMEQFDGKDFSHTVKIETNTELDKIGNSYNEMLQNIENLLNEIKKQEKELRTSELNMLINQIKPHFLYNTLEMVIPELIRILTEEKNFNIDTAVDVVSKSCAYTNHTILAEALEKWPISYLEKVVPQLMPIIRDLDRRVRRDFHDERVYIIDNMDRVHMAHIDIHFGYAVNGVAALHTEILKESELKPFYDIYPQKFNNWWTLL